MWGEPDRPVRYAYPIRDEGFLARWPWKTGVMFALLAAVVLGLATGITPPTITVPATTTVWRGWLWRVDRTMWFDTVFAFARGGLPVPVTVPERPPPAWSAAASEQALGGTRVHEFATGWPARWLVYPVWGVNSKGRYEHGAGRVYMPGLLLDLLVALATGLVPICWVGWGRARVAIMARRAGPSHCRGCGYDRTGVPGGRPCPECGGRG